MGQSYFIWNGMDCRNMGVGLSGPVPIVRPEERVQHIEIPGRSGDMTLLEGEEIYNSYIQTASVFVRGGSRVREIYNWLKGSGYVTFSGEPDRKQSARIIGAVTLNKHSKNMDVWEGEVQFYCQPLKQLLLSDTVEITTSGSTVYNRGDVKSKPLITLTASATSATVVIGGKTLTLTGITSGNSYLIDCDAEEMSDTLRTTIMTGKTSGPFPQLDPGSNTVTGTGWSKLAFDRRERFL